MALAEGEEVDLLRAARRVGGAGQRLAAGERVDQCRLADIGAPGEADLGAVGGRACRPSPRRLSGSQPRGRKGGGPVPPSGRRAFPREGREARSCQCRRVACRDPAALSHHGVDAEFRVAPAILERGKRGRIAPTGLGVGLGRAASGPMGSTMSNSASPILSRLPTRSNSSHGARPSSQRLPRNRRGSSGWPIFCDSALSEALVQDRDRGEGRVAHPHVGRPDKRGGGATVFGIDWPEPREQRPGGAPRFRARSRYRGGRDARGGLCRPPRAP